MDNVKSPRGASSGCYIARRTSGRVPSANTLRQSGKDIASGPARVIWTGPCPVCLANAAVAV